VQEEDVNAKTQSQLSDLIIQDNNARASVIDDLEIVDSSLHFINDLLRNLLDMQRASSKELTIEEKATHLMDDVFHPVSNMLHIPKGSDIKVEVRCDATDAEDLVVMADSLRLKQILLNLTRNSAKFVSRGYIRMRARVVEEDNDPSTGKVAKRIELSVEDSGPGIPKKKRNQIFNKFQETLDSLNQGTGIGLNLCLKLSNLMGADLYIDESYDSGIPGFPGTRFVLDLKKPPFKLTTHILESISNDSEFDLRSKDTELDTPTSSMEPSSILSFNQNDVARTNVVEDLPENLNVLFTDDDMVLRKLFSRSLKKVAPSWNIKEASNGETAIQLAHKDNQFDLIFMDQYMASVTKQLLGTEATRALRGMGITSIICGLSANDVEQAFLEAGANAFMFKPFPCRPDMLKAELIVVVVCIAYDAKNIQCFAPLTTPLLVTAPILLLDCLEDFLDLWILPVGDIKYTDAPQKTSLLVVTSGRRLPTYL